MSQTSSLPVAVVAILCFNREKQDVDPLDRKIVLVIDRSFDLPKYKFPGGSIRPAEDPLCAAVRELKEETGLVVDLDDLQIIYDEDRNENHIVRYFACEADLSTALEIGDENGRSIEVERRYSIRELLTGTLVILRPHLQILEQLQRQLDHG